MCRFGSGNGTRGYGETNQAQKAYWPMLLIVPIIFAEERTIEGSPR